MLDFISFCQAEVEQLLVAKPGKTGLYLLYEDQTYGFNEHAIFPAASTIKIPLLLVALNHNPEARFTSLPKTGGSSILEYFTGSYQFTYNDILLCMIALSDNSATNAVIDLLGFDKIAKGFTDLGLEKTRLRRKMMDFDARKRGLDNTATPYELVRLLASLSKESLTSLRFFLSKQLSREGLGFFLTEGSVENKTGSLDTVFNDVGILHLGKELLYYAYFSKDVNVGESIINAGLIGRKFTNWYNRL